LRVYGVYVVYPMETTLIVYNTMFKYLYYVTETLILFFRK